MSEVVDSDNPYLPVDLPEFGMSVGWAMCRNTMCRNFGIQYAGPAHTNETWLSDGRYELNPRTGEFKCGHCGSSFTLNSNRAIRVLARHFLSLSLPFATCFEEGCENYGHNVFENYTPYRTRNRRYRRHQDDHRVLCRMCAPKQTTFPLGVAKYLERHSKEDSTREVRKKDRAALRKLRSILKGAMYYRSVWMILEDFDVDANTYYTQLVRAGNRLRDYHAWRNAKLLQAKFAQHDAPVRVYTDTLRVSLARFGKETPGFTHLDIPVSVVDLPQDRTYYILAAHPGFLPENLCQTDPARLLKEVAGPAHLSPWACTFHPGHRGEHGDVESVMSSLPDIGREGWFARSPYIELAHFLTLRKMLSRFRTVYHYMDAQHVQSEAALTAFAEDIRAGRCEIALYQRKRRAPPEHEPRERWPSPASGDIEEWLKGRLDLQWQQREGRWPVQGEGEDEGSSAGDVMPEAQFRATQFAPARKGARDVGGWAWLDFPPPGPRYNGGHALWLTQRPEVTYEDVGRELLWSANVLRVDSAHSHLRDDVRALQRASFKAEPGRSHRKSPRDPAVVMAEVWLAIFWRNYGPRRPPRYKLKKGEKPRLIPAGTMGLARSNEPRKPNLGSIVWNFQLGVREAARMTRWSRT